MEMEYCGTVDGLLYRGTVGEDILWNNGDVLWHRWSIVAVVKNMEYCSNGDED